MGKKKKVKRLVSFRFESLESERKYGEPVFAREFTAKSKAGAVKERKLDELRKKRHKDAFSAFKSQRGKMSRQATRESKPSYGKRKIQESGRSAGVKVYKMDSFTSQDMA